MYRNIVLRRRSFVDRCPSLMAALMVAGLRRSLSATPGMQTGSSPTASSSACRGTQTTTHMPTSPTRSAPDRCNMHSHCADNICTSSERSYCIRCPIQHAVHPDQTVLEYKRSTSCRISLLYLAYQLLIDQYCCSVDPLCLVLESAAMRTTFAVQLGLDD